MSFAYGVAFGLLKIAWIVLAAVYLYDISVETGQFEVMKESVAGITADRRLQYRRMKTQIRRFSDRFVYDAIERIDASDEARLK